MSSDVVDRASIDAPAANAAAPADAYALPASFGQRRLWFLDQLMPGSPFYNIHVALPLDFRVREDVLRRALDEIVRRHETLRTTFAEDGGEPVQIVADERRQALPVHDLRHLPPAERVQELGRLAAEDARRPFDLATGPLLRTRLVTTAPDAHTLLVTLHHIVTDAWSMGLLFREIATLYGAFAAHRPSPLPELPLQYGDYATWQSEQLDGQRLDAELAYWRAQLDGLPVLDLPVDRPRPPIPTFAGASYRFQVATSLGQELRALARRADCTPFMVLLALYCTLLHRYTGQDDVVVGLPIANRRFADLEGLIGFFVNTLVLRVDLSGDPNVVELLERVRETTLEAYAHQDLPFEKLVEELQPERELSRNPLFQTTFQLHNEPGSAASDATGTDGATARRTTANFDIVFDLWPAGDGFAASVDYATDLFDATTIVRLAGHYRQLLSSALLDPEQRLSEMEMLTGDERRVLLVDWNATTRPYPRDALIHTLFAERAAEHPAAPAVRLGERRLDYAELDALSDRVAQGLLRRGLRPGQTVAIAVERSLEMIVGLLGILKAGGRYLALEPTDPAPRREASLAEGDAAFLLILRRSMPEPRATSLETLLLELEDGDFVDEPAMPPSPDRRASDAPAYLCFTSGSTGRPKGVDVPHRAVTRLVRNNPFVRVDAEQRFLQLSPLAFDASTFEIWGALLNGAELVVHPPGTPSLHELGRVISESGVTTLWLTSGLFHQLLDAEPACLDGVSQVLAGGDVVSPAHVRRLLERPGERIFVNGYGPTECTTFTCCHALRSAAAVGANVPIGKPIANTRVFVLDAHMNAVPVGVPGELFVGGDGLASGYLNRPAETDAAFVANPFAPSERLYRTGDFVRWRADGELEFLGRRDLQTKVRGYRVEPAAVEAVLREAEGVRDAAVLPVDDVAGLKQLAAYVIPRAGATLAPDALAAFVRARLPAYMVPASHVVVEAFPLTANGKLDARRLGGEDDARPDGKAHVGPRDELEERLAGLWTEVLGRADPGVHDDFFTDLGGHSLLGTLLISRFREAFGVDVPLTLLFEHPTIAAQAVAIEQAVLAEIDSMSDEEAERLSENDGY